MSDANVQMGRHWLAFHRFGLGARPGESLGSDTRGWALDQLSRFDPAPTVIAQQPKRGELITMFADYRAEVRRQKEQSPEAGQDMGMSGSMAENMAGSSGRRNPERSAESSANRQRNRQGRSPNQLRRAYFEATNARVTSAVQTDTPFAERLVHFWSNHFAVSADKQPVVPLAGDYEFTAIRPYVMGNFRDLLKAAVRHPAMMLYLDQAQSIGPNSEVARRAARRRRQNRRVVGLNENLAREIMELHTLGVRSGYSQEDVTEFARALTGWTVAGLARGRMRRLVQGTAGETQFIAAMHEPGARTILGRRYPEGGTGQAEAILEDLARSRATAKNIATKLVTHFAADQPPPTMVTRLERAFLDSDGDLPTVYQAMVNSPEAWSTQTLKFRNPWDWMIGMLRASEIARLPGGRGAAPIFRQLGQAVWAPGSPAGWSDKTEDWAGPGALMMRAEVAQQIGSRLTNKFDPRKLAPAVLSDGLAQATAQAIARAESSETGLALLFSSPEFLRR